MASNELPTVAANEIPPEPLHHCRSPNCNKSFKLAYRLKEHIQRKHTKPMSCGFTRCKYRSGSQSSMKRHRLRLHHTESDVSRIIHSAPEVTATVSLCSLSSPSLPPPSTPSISPSSPSITPSSTSLSPSSTSVPPPSSSAPPTISRIIYPIAGTRPGFGYPAFAQGSTAGRISTDHSQPTPLIDLTTENTIYNQLGPSCIRGAVWDYCGCWVCDPVAQLLSREPTW